LQTLGSSTGSSHACCLPPIVSATPKGGSCGGMKPEPVVSPALHLPSHQHLHDSAVERLPRRLSYPCPRLPEVGRSLLGLVAREHDQIERLLFFCTLLGPVLDPYQRGRQQCARALFEPVQAVLRRVAARYEKRVANYQAIVVTAALMVWLTSGATRDRPYLKSVGYRLSKKSRLTSSPRLRTPTFSKTLRRWFWTVCSEI
jgi:hypothetical protein